MICNDCKNFIEHCRCLDFVVKVSNGTPPKCPPTCICEFCIEEAMNAALMGVGGGVMPGEALTEHVKIKDSKACDCGAQAIGSGAHSFWCSAYIE